MIQTVSDAVGFRAKFDPNYREFLHPTGLVLLTGAGAISSYLLGWATPPGTCGQGLCAPELAASPSPPCRYCCSASITT